jgi:hypothetical protein
LENKISGSENMWEAQGEMEHLTGKLVRPKDFRPKAVIEKEKRDNEKKLK